MEQDPVAVTKAVFERFGAQDIPAILELMAPDIVIDFYGPSVIPYAGHYERLPGAERFFRTVLSAVDIHQFDAEQFFTQGEMVAVTGRLALTARATGWGIESDFAHIITVRTGKWAWFRDFMNTAAAAAAFAP